MPPWTDSYVGASGSAGRAATAAETSPRKRAMSAAGRKRIAEAQRKRWAAFQTVGARRSRPEAPAQPGGCPGRRRCHPLWASGLASSAITWTIAGDRPGEPAVNIPSGAIEAMSVRLIGRYRPVSHP